ncbi:helicase associated domain-containing protein [Kitasatospora sp. NPDC006786]|uniref:helicase associated domain-containing protein n=1 Tax=unclassified Kitasatospora TaxID=2633591 RepID=UPI0034103DA2
MEALAGIDPDWNHAWPLDWQRHYAAVADCVEGGAQLGDLPPGATLQGLDVGRWVERQRQHIVWQGLMDGQRERLVVLGVEPLAAPAEEAVPKKKPSAGAANPQLHRLTQPANHHPQGQGQEAEGEGCRGGEFHFDGH